MEQNKNIELSKGTRELALLIRTICNAVWELSHWYDEYELHKSKWNEESEEQRKEFEKCSGHFCNKINDAYLPLSHFMDDLFSDRINTTLYGDDGDEL